MKNAKKEIEDQLPLYTDIDTILEGSLQQVAKNILALEEKLKKEHQMVIQNPDVYIRFNMRIHDGDFEGDSTEIRLSGVRLETDGEYKTRIEKNKRALRAQRESVKKRLINQKKEELAMLAKLQKKYGK